MNINRAIHTIAAIGIIGFGISPDFSLRAEDCNWGCGFHRRVETIDVNKRRKVSDDGIPYVMFYVHNLGPYAIRKLSISPEWYQGWGCVPGWIFGGSFKCNRLEHRIERGETHLFGIYYSDDKEGEVYDVRILDSQENSGKGYQIHIPRQGSIPILYLRSSSKNRRNCNSGRIGVSARTDSSAGFTVNLPWSCDDSYNPPAMHMVR